MPRDPVTGDEVVHLRPDECAYEFPVEHFRIERKRCGARLLEHGQTIFGYERIHHTFVFPPLPPQPHEIVQAHIETQWTCHACGYDQDVWGVAEHEWMECQNPECSESSYLVTG